MSEWTNNNDFEAQQLVLILREYTKKNAGRAVGLGLVIPGYKNDFKAQRIMSEDEEQTMWM